MKLSDVVGHSGLSGYAEVALILFFVAFLLVVARVFWPGRKGELERASQLPFDDGERRTAHGDH